MRVLDVLLACTGLVVASPLLLVLYVAGLFDTGAPLFLQERIGRRRQPFTMVKFRTMRLSTPSVASHLAEESAVTGYGRFLRRTKLDELPQLWNVLCGQMSLVGPRPCLPSQEELISERDRLGVFEARPGITGIAQLGGIDMSTPRLLAETDAQMLAQMAPRLYFLCILRTIRGSGNGDALGRQAPGDAEAQEPRR